MNIPSVTSSPVLTTEEMRRLEQNYQNQDFSEVLEFIARHPDLVTILPEAPAQIGVHFPGDQLSLQC